MSLPTRIFQANPLLSILELEEAVNVLSRGDLLALPTETVYGLAADLSNEKALLAIFREKRRPVDNPLIAHIGAMEQLLGLVKDPPAIFYKLVKQFWPGPLTLITKSAEGVSSILTAGIPTVAIRMPSHPCALQVLRRFGPLAAPSANLSGRPSPTSARDVLEDFQDRIPLVIDGGQTDFGIESTVLNICEDKPVLLRPGAISRETIEEFLGLRLSEPKEGEVPAAPGMKYRHYAPKAKVHLVKTQEDLQELQKRGAYVPSQLTAKNLYTELRMADRLGKSEIAIYLHADLLTDEALMNRLEKASI